MNFKIYMGGGSEPAQSVKHRTLDLGAVGFSPTLDIVTLKKKKKD